MTELAQNTEDKKEPVSGRAAHTSRLRQMVTERPSCAQCGPGPVQSPVFPEKAEIRFLNSDF